VLRRALFFLTDRTLLALAVILWGGLCLLALAWLVSLA
jgi:hypothetical protein